MSIEENNRLFVYKSIVRDMSEGIITLNMNGRITYVNPAAISILGFDTEQLLDKPFATVFFQYRENDSFNQAVLDAIYENAVSHNTTVDYYDGKDIKKLFVNTSFLRNGDEKIGVAVVLNDITELTELQDAVKTMEHIKSLNKELSKRNEFIKKTFGRYLSDDIVNEILNSDDGLVIGGKKQQVVIMFSDIRGFTAVSEEMEPHDLIKMLNHYLEQMIVVVQRHKGTILEFIGDAIVAVFGAPLESVTADIDAVSCAVEMQCAMKQVNEYNAKMEYPSIEMGIGIHSGEVVVGNIGSEKKTKYDIIGKNVNLASRIETFTVGGQIYVSPVTKNNIGAALVTRGEITISPKGVKKPITIYDVAACGQYTMPDNTQHFSLLLPPIDICFSVIEGKFAADVSFEGKITEFSEKQAKLISNAVLPVSTNIKFIRNNIEIFAKVVNSDESGVVIHFTKGKLN